MMLQNFNVTGDISISKSEMFLSLYSVDERGEFHYQVTKGKIIPDLSIKSLNYTAIVFIHVDGENHNTHYHFVDNNPVDVQTIKKHINIGKVIDDTLVKLLKDINQNRQKAL